ncbi:hypothetical protein [Clostridium beijerinckii]|uniref:Ribbon-helix-helix protein CopG domain-containing protein n=1 Tax=Clostridium beijerinckii TaxID=1520 RepID=A0AAW3WEE2_CLOBE|nr:hypothetical protein [Clostridium beijerinckii]MBC2459395.1 hypothetical protein [Clostridium beijerinckii]MBC2476909.1 hypothetical protein [Clostridium beijerinckii]NOV62729.1 Arc/MetJ-type ribon-helix-helix transcriptional regulator [Clostridium beijerinckii]NOV70309.1 Arc/MetJ-type ribon-helix-helix transcriptional regulator [Clostridium beijerinckii]NOW30783.1 Arc/MetJ-type ribon-helix-helix transcriptional regulator [Clostridium beijerinckii]
MATKQITTRIEEDLIEKVQERINSIKSDSRGGTEINLSTVIRYALEKYLEEQKEIDRGVVNLKFEIDKFSLSDLEKLEPTVNKLSDTFSAGYKENIEFSKSAFMLDEAIKYQIYKLKENK